MRDWLTAELGPDVALVTPDGIADGLPTLRAAGQGAATVLCVIGESVPKLDRALLIAAIGPLAVEFAPAVRIVALDLADGAHPDDVAAAAIFLTGAASTTGQLLHITPR